MFEQCQELLSTTEPTLDHNGHYLQQQNVGKNMVFERRGSGVDVKPTLAAHWREPTLTVSLVDEGSKDQRREQPVARGKSFGLGLTHQLR